MNFLWPILYKILPFQIVWKTVLWYYSHTYVYAINIVFIAYQLSGSFIKYFISVSAKIGHRLFLGTQCNPKKSLRILQKNIVEDEMMLEKFLPFLE